MRVSSYLEYRSGITAEPRRSGGSVSGLRGQITTRGGRGHFGHCSAAAREELLRPQTESKLK